MPTTLTYFVHGISTDNAAGKSSGWNDVELSDLGKKQALELRELTKDKKFDLVFCSDLKRAYDTAMTAFEGRTPIIPDSRLRECNYGKYNGQPSDIVEPLQDKMITKPFPGGESYEDVKKRVSEFLFDLLKQESANGNTANGNQNQDRNIAIVSHKAPQLALDVLLKGKTWEQAFAEDWRNTKAWKPGWEYEIS